MVGLDKRYNMNRTSNRLWLVGIKQLVDSYLWPLVQLYSAKTCSSFLEWLGELHWVSEENLGLWPLLVVFCWILRSVSLFGEAGYCRSLWMSTVGWLYDSPILEKMRTQSLSLFLHMSTRLIFQYAIHI